MIEKCLRFPWLRSQPWCSFFSTRPYDLFLLDQPSSWSLNFLCYHSLRLDRQSCIFAQKACTRLPFLTCCGEWCFFYTVYEIQTVSTPCGSVPRLHSPRDSCDDLGVYYFAYLFSARECEWIRRTDESRSAHIVKSR